jgi:two-component system phosphate regulon response regulator PhoB
MSQPSILIVEDETDLADLLAYHLEHEGYACRRVGDGERALAEAGRRPPDLVILDRMLPGLSGDEVARRLKRDDRTDEDELVGFALGADDYVRKPFSVKLLLARVAAVLRRPEARENAREVLSAGTVVLDHGRHEVRVAGQAVALTATEFRILGALMAARGRVLTRAQLIDLVIGPGAPVTNRAMDVHIASLRKKLGSAGELVHTVRGVGYSFRLPEQEPGVPLDSA